MSLGISQRSRTPSVTALCLALALGVTACRIVPLVDPPRTPAAETSQASRAAIIRALVEYGYIVDEESPGRIRARLQKSGWSYAVDILYDKDISIHYADSAGLSYQVKQDVPYIHRGYNRRTDDLLAEIRRQVTIASIESRPMPGVGSPPPPPPPQSPPQ